MDNLTPITREEMLMNDEPLTPITREEKILAGEDLECVTRREYFLKKYRHAGGDVMVEGLSVTENGTYTAPEGKAYSPVEVAVPLPENAYLLKEASGSLVSFSDGADLPMPSFICNIDAVQDLHGYDHPWVGGAGKNKLNITTIKPEKTENGITFTVNTDGTVIANGTATSRSQIYWSIPMETAKLFSGMIMNGCPSISGTQLRLELNSSPYTLYGVDRGNGVTISSSIESVTDSCIVIFRIDSGVTVNNIVFKPMIRLATVSDATFEPYSNICPISGHTGVDAWVRGKNLAEDGFAWNVNADGIIESTALYNTSVIPVRKNERYIQTIDGVLANIGVIAFYYERPSIGSQSYNKSRSVNLMSPIFTAPINGYAVIRNAVTDTNIQIEKGNTATSYEPYNPNSQTIQVSWQTEAGEVFGGYVDLVSGELTVTHYKKQLTRDMDWSKSSTGYNAFYVSGAKISPARKERTAAICNIAKYSSGSEYVSKPWCLTRDGSLGMSTDENIIGGTTIDNWKDYISNNTVEICYELETPIVIQLDGNQIKSLLGTNNAWCDTGDVNVDYFAKEVTG